MSQHCLSQAVDARILRAVTDVLHGSGFGSVEIVLHGHVTLIEKREKLRLLHKHSIEGADILNCVSIKSLMPHHLALATNIGNRNEIQNKKV